MSRGKSLAKALVSQLDESGMRDFIMEPGDALQLLSKRTLLVVVGYAPAGFCGISAVAGKGQNRDRH